MLALKPSASNRSGGSRCRKNLDRRRRVPFVAVRQTSIVKHPLIRRSTGLVTECRLDDERAEFCWRFKAELVKRLRLSFFAVDICLGPRARYERRLFIRLLRAHVWFCRGFTRIGNTNRGACWRPFEIWPSIEGRDGRPRTSYTFADGRACIGFSDRIESLADGLTGRYRE